MKKAIFYAGTASLLAFLLMFPRESVAGARQGLLLWYHTLVPSLFPLMILSRLLLATGLAYCIACRISRPFAALLKLSPYGVYALFTGFLCGCPMGAKVLSDLRRSGQISRAEASYLVVFCNNLSPAFFLHYLVLQQLSGRLPGPTLCILFGAPLLYGLLTNRRFCREHAERQSLSAVPQNKAPATAAAMVDACIMDSICGITKLGGYVILFSVVSAAADVFAARFLPVKALLLGTLEVSRGLDCLAGLTLPFRKKYVLLIAASAFGGLCCAAQSAQMLSEIGIPLKRYLRARLAIAVIAAAMAMML